MNDQNWLNFVNSGRIEDYLRYKQEGESEDNEYDQWVSYQATNNWGE